MGGSANVGFREGGVGPWHWFGGRFCIRVTEYVDHAVAGDESHRVSITGNGYYRNPVRVDCRAAGLNLLDMALGTMNAYIGLHEKVYGYDGRNRIDHGTGNRVILPVLRQHGLVPDTAQVRVLRGNREYERILTGYHQIAMIRDSKSDGIALLCSITLGADCASRVFASEDMQNFMILMDGNGFSRFGIVLAIGPFDYLSLMRALSCVVPFSRTLDEYVSDSGLNSKWMKENLLESLTWLGGLVRQYSPNDLPLSVAWEELVMKIPELECVPAPDHEVKPVLARRNDNGINTGAVIVDRMLVDDENAPFIMISPDNTQSNGSR